MLAPPLPIVRIQGIAKHYPQFSITQLKLESRVSLVVGRSGQKRSILYVCEHFAHEPNAEITLLFP